MSTELDPEWMEPLQGGKLDPEALSRLRRGLANRPPEAERLEEELALEDALNRLPRVEAPSNFTARVLQAVEREERTRAQRPRRLVGWWRSFHWGPQTAAATIIAGLLFAGWQFRVQQRIDLARSVADVASATGAGNLAVENLKDFDAIQLLREPPRPDDVELLTALSQ